MRTLYASFFAMLVVVAGCKHETPLGGPGAPRDTLEGRYDPAQTTEMFFALTLPELVSEMPVVVHRGKDMHLTIGIHRGAQFKEKVRVDFPEAPKWLTFTPANGEILPNQDKLVVTAHVAQDAPLGETSVFVDGLPTLGKASRTKLRLKVER